MRWLAQRKADLLIFFPYLSVQLSRIIYSLSQVIKFSYLHARLFKFGEVVIIPYVSGNNAHREALFLTASFLEDVKPPNYLPLYKQDFLQCKGHCMLKQWEM